MNKDDKRLNILELLEEYKSSDKLENELKQKIVDFVKSNPECFNNDFKFGHITGSALVVDRNIKFTLLNYHRKLNKWLQFGGHSDGLHDVVQTAKREALEESGLTSLKPLDGFNGVFDVDVHQIPEKREMPSHLHYDIRIILTADKNEEIKISDESKDLRWVRLDEANKYNDSASFVRLIQKAINI